MPKEKKPVATTRADILARLQKIAEMTSLERELADTSPPLPEQQQTSG